ncbi:MAG: 2-dehydro-3-deoxyphosphogluconate aldolase [Actinobacteria bacterium]|nr:2-dehydro-3-deoxyphosphogluconate aldolase [Actinomycetota bacterium]
MNAAIDAITKHRIVIIYRGLGPQECLEFSRHLLDAGIAVFEVTMNSPAPIDAINLLRDELAGDAEIGAGTVLSAREVDAAAGAGASFIISPNLDASVIRRTKQLGLVSIPGTFTATEVAAAVAAGADIVKIFPINVVGAEYLRQLRGPLASLPCMPSGGITLELATELFDAGATAIGIGVHLLGRGLVETRDWKGLRSRATEFVRAAGL